MSENQKDSETNNPSDITSYDLHSNYCFDKDKYIMMRLNRSLFGMLVDNIEDVLTPHDITPIPLAPPEVMGSLNLRGRIVTAINLKVKLSLVKNNENSDDKKKKSKQKNIVIEHDGQLYSFLVDEVSEILDIAPEEIAGNPENISEEWKNYSKGIFTMKDELMVILDMEKLVSQS